jgi:hypothetical protein
MTVVQPLTKHDGEQLIADWQERLNALSEQVIGWAGEEGWKVTERQTEILEEMLPRSYSAPVLEVTTEQGRVILEPKARIVLLSGGRVDMYAYPTLNRVRLLWDEKQAEWFILTDSNIEWPHPWRRETFAELVRGLLRHR